MHQAVPTVDEKVETIHLYVVRVEEKRPHTALPLFCAFLCLLGIVAVTFYSAQHPYYEHERLTVPAEFLPLKVFTAQVPIIPTGVKIYPATSAHGPLTITNGSVISQTLPAGFMFISSSGISVATDSSVFVPAGNVDGYGYATVATHALVSGKAGNIPAYSIDQVEGSRVYIRNLSAFRGGRDSYSVKFATSQDRQLALSKSRDLLTASAIELHYPCTEQVSGTNTIKVTWRCQFVTYSVPSYMHVTGAQLAGKNVLVSVMYILRPAPMHWVK